VNTKSHKQFMTAWEQYRIYTAVILRWLLSCAREDVQWELSYIYDMVFTGICIEIIIFWNVTPCQMKYKNARMDSCAVKIQ
jgi:hypothetical protein